MKIDTINYMDILPIRHKVLWPNKPIIFCKLEDDPKGIHYGGFINGKLISVASIFIDNSSARLRKFATLDEYQNNGYGTTMINHIIKELIELGIETFWCDARVTAEAFYNRFGMSKQGEIFLKSDVEYVVMKRELKSSL
jgi:predicted GNAT family N-acyltransferase